MYVFFDIQRSPGTRTKTGGAQDRCGYEGFSHGESFLLRYWDRTATADATKKEEIRSIRLDDTV